MLVRIRCLAPILLLCVTWAASAQTTAVEVPRLIRLEGDTSLPSSTVAIQFSIYKDQTGGAPIWLETQLVQTSKEGKYSALLGSSNDAGVPADVFSGEGTRWLGVKVAENSELPRTMIVSVPYALRAGDAETLGGKPLTAFVLHEAAPSAQPTGTVFKTNVASATSVANVTSGTANYLAKFTSSVDLGDSAIMETGGMVGINVAPSAPLTVTGGGSHLIKVIGSAGNNVISTYVTGTNKRASLFVNQAGAAVLEGWEDGRGPLNFALAPVSGNVGINTSTPAYPLTVSGANSSHQIAAIGAAGANAITSFVAGSTRRSSMYVGANGSAVLEGWDDSKGPLNLALAPAGGNVGISNSSPQFPLTVSNANAVHQIAAVGPAGSNVISSFVTGTSKRASLFINQAGAAVMEGWDDAAGPLNFAIGPAGGNVGINTSVPQYPLTVAGTVGPHKIAALGSAGANLVSSFVAGSQKRASLYVDAANNAVVEGADSTVALNVALAPNGGRVGIGTRSPTTALDINGTLRTTGGVQFADGTVMTSAVAGGVFNGVVAGASPAGVLFATQTGPGAIGASPISTPSGVHGSSTAQSNAVTGVLGDAVSTSGYGVLGVNAAAAGDAIGVAGYSSVSPAGIGVYGEGSSTDPNGTATGVFGLVNTMGLGSTGVAGESLALSGDTTGVYGAAMSSTGYGVEGDAYALSGIAIGVAGFSDSDQGRGVLGNATALSGTTYGVRGITQSDGGTGVAGLSNSPTGQTVGVSGEVASTTGVAGQFTNTSGTGNILVGRSGASTTVFRLDGTGKGFFNGGTQTNGADFAESFAVRGDKRGYEAGDLMAIDETGIRRLKQSDESYSTLVAGVYSTRPGVLAQPYAIDSPQHDGDIPLAVVGVVPLKVTAINGAIRAGDLLVSSPLPGRAMKGTDPSRMLGAIVGKALGSLMNGEGVIEALVTLQ